MMNADGIQQAREIRAHGAAECAGRLGGAENLIIAGAKMDSAMRLSKGVEHLCASRRDAHDHDPRLFVDELERGIAHAQGTIRDTGELVEQEGRSGRFG